MSDEKSIAHIENDIITYQKPQEGDKHTKADGTKYVYNSNNWAKVLSLEEKIEELEARLKFLEEK